MALTHYSFDETWYVDAPPDTVWPVITDVPGYPAWWPQFRTVTRLNDLDGPGARASVLVKSTLPYLMRFELELVRQEPSVFSEVRCRGDLSGWMRWDLASAGNSTRLRFRETVQTGKTLLNVLAPLLKPAFAWNHRTMMAEGERGLRQLLAQRGYVAPISLQRSSSTCS